MLSVHFVYVPSSLNLLALALVPSPTPRLRARDLPTSSHFVLRSGKLTSLFCPFPVSRLVDELFNDRIIFSPPSCCVCFCFIAQAVSPDGHVEVFIRFMDNLDLWQSYQTKVGDPEAWSEFREGHCPNPPYGCLLPEQDHYFNSQVGSARVGSGRVPSGRSRRWRGVFRARIERISIFRLKTWFA